MAGPGQQAAGKDRSKTSPAGGDRSSGGSRQTANGIQNGNSDATNSTAAQHTGVDRPSARTDAGGSNPFAGPGGGTTTQYGYVPGAVPNFPNANAAAVLDQLSGAIPGVGTANSVYKGAKAVMGEDSTFGPLGDMLGADTGPQAGYQPDRDRNTNGGPASDGGMLTPASRAIVGDDDGALGAGAAAVTGDDYSDVSLQDVPMTLRRKGSMATGLLA